MKWHPPNRYTREEMVVSAVRVYDSYAEDGLCMKISFWVFGCNTSCVGEEKALKIQEVSEAEKYKILIL